MTGSTNKRDGENSFTDRRTKTPDVSLEAILTHHNCLSYVTVCEAHPEENPEGTIFLYFSFPVKGATLALPKYV